jgi:hypothetical protein
MTATCAECRTSIDEDDMMMEDGFSSSSGCVCPVHAKCLDNRVQLCMRAGVVQVRCARCWAVIWVQRKRMLSDCCREEDAKTTTNRRRLV